MKRGRKEELGLLKFSGDVKERTMGGGWGGARVGVKTFVSVSDSIYF